VGRERTVSGHCTLTQHIHLGKYTRESVVQLPRMDLKVQQSYKAFMWYEYKPRQSAIHVTNVYVSLVCAGNEFYKKLCSLQLLFSDCMHS